MAAMDTLIAPRPQPRPAPPAPRSLLYVLHSGQLFGTERMAITTLAGLAGSYDCTLLAPPGAVHGHASAQGLQVRSFQGRLDLVRQMARAFAGRRELVLVSTGLAHALTGVALARLLRLRLRHIHIVHGGAAEALSYGRKKWLRWFELDFVAVSQFVRQRLVAHGVPAARITVIENFLAEEARPQRARYSAPVASLIVVARLDPIKQVGLLLDALAEHPGLGCWATIYGTGWEQGTLARRAERECLPLRFAGFSSTVGASLAQADLLVHTCAQEPFGLVVLEAMAAGVLVLVPDSGGPSEFIDDGVNGFVYRANDAAALAARIEQIGRLDGAALDAVVAAARRTLARRFAAPGGIARYGSLLAGAAA
jgi:glycosyltransferase involved in cell wall biosynthesis